MVKEYKLPYNFAEDAKQPTSDPRRTITASKVQEQFEYVGGITNDMMPLDGSRVMEGNLDMNGHSIVNATLEGSADKKVFTVLEADYSQNYAEFNKVRSLTLTPYSFNYIYLNILNYTEPFIETAEEGKYLNIELLNGLQKDLMLRVVFPPQVFFLNSKKYLQIDLKILGANNLVVVAKHIFRYEHPVVGDYNPNDYKYIKQQIMAACNNCNLASFNFEGLGAIEGYYFDILFKDFNKEKEG